VRQYLWFVVGWTLGYKSALVVDDYDVGFFPMYFFGVSIFAELPKGVMTRSYKTSTLSFMVKSPFLTSIFRAIRPALLKQDIHGYHYK
jgi:hypothetical protein